MAAGTIPLWACRPLDVCPCRGFSSLARVGSVNTCPALHLALLLLYLSPTKQVQVCRINPYGWQDRDNAAEPRPSSVGHRARCQGCPGAGTQPWPAQGPCPGAHPRQPRLAGDAAAPSEPQLWPLWARWALPGAGLCPGLAWEVNWQLCAPRCQLPRASSAALEPCPALAAAPAAPSHLPSAA